MGGPDFIELRSYGFQFFKTADIIPHISVFTEHKDATVFLDGIAADEHPLIDVQYSNTSGRMSWQVDDLQLSAAQVDLITVQNGDQLSAFS